MAKNLQSLAGEMSKAFIGDKRNDGTEFRKLRDGSPQWMTDVIHKAHGDMMPDDQRYAMIEEACDAISQALDNVEDVSEGDVDDAISEARDSLEADIYTSDLTTWLGSRADRTCYVDDAMEELGNDFTGIVQAIQIGQLAEKWEVFDLAVSALQELVTDEDDWDEGEHDPKLIELLNAYDRPQLLSIVEKMGQDYSSLSDDGMREMILLNIEDGTISEGDLP